MSSASVRRLLVVGARCADNKDGYKLERLASAAKALFDVMADGERGGCSPLELDGLTSPGFLDDPSIEQANIAITAALDVCAKNKETLVLAWLGHGEAVTGTLYLLPRDADFASPTLKSFDLVSLIVRVVQAQKGQPLAALILLLDTCHSGSAAPEAAKSWIAKLDNNLAFELFTSTNNKETYDCRFTSALADAIDRGLPRNGSDYLYINDLKPVVEAAYRGDQPQHIMFSGSKWHDDLWLCKNHGRLMVDRALALAAAAEQACEPIQLAPRLSARLARTLFVPGRFDRGMRLGVLACRATGRDYTLPQARASLLRAADGNRLLSQLRWSEPRHVAGFSSDGQYIISRTENTVHIHIAMTGESVGKPLKHKSRVTRATVSADGSRVITVSGLTTLCVWCLATQELVDGPMTFEPPPLPFADRDWRIVATFDQRPALLVAACTVHISGLAVICDLATGNLIKLFAQGGPWTHFEGRITSAAFSPDGRRVITTASSHEAKLWDAQTGEQIGKDLSHGDSVWHAAFSPDGKSVVTASDDGTARIWEVEAVRKWNALQFYATHLEPKPDKKETMLVHLAGVRFASFSADGKRVVTASKDHTAQIWSAKTGDAIEAPLLHVEPVRRATLSTDGRRILTVTNNRTCVWKTTRSLTTIRCQGYSDKFESAKIDLDGHVITGSSDGMARLWDVGSGRQLGRPLQHERAVYGVEVNPKRQCIVTIANAVAPGTYQAFDDDFYHLPRSTARLWDLSTFDPIGEPLVHEVHITQAKFSPDGHLVATASWDGTTRIWSGDTGLPIGPPLMHAWGVSSINFSHDSKRIVTGSLDATAGERFRYHMEVDSEWDAMPGAARVWDVATLQPLTNPIPHEGTVSLAVFSPDATRVLTVCKAVAQVWDVSTGRPIGLRMLHLDHIWSAAFNRHGDCIVTSSSDGTARLWWASTGKPIGATLKHDGTCVSCACFSPDGRLVATAGHDGTARIWEASTGRPLGEPMRHDNELDHVHSVQFSSDGRRLLSWTTHGVWLWELAWHGIEVAEELIEAVSRTLPADAAFITQGDVLAAWPLSHDDIGKNVFDWTVD